MRSPSKRVGCAALLLSIASCESIAGLEGKLFESGSKPATGGSAAPTGGRSSQGGTSAGGTRSLGGNAGVGVVAGAGADSIGGEGGEAGTTGGGAGVPGCADIAAELCMRPTWPNGIVPYRIESDSELVRASLRGALSAWEGKRIDSSVLRFVENSRPSARTLVMTLDDGCHPVSLTDDEVEIATGDCPPGSLEMSHAVGVTLGLPSMHRRADRDRYLVMAEPAEFACEEGEFFEMCADRDGVPAMIGPFDFGSVMFIRTESFDDCLAEPDAPRLYSARGELATTFEACSWITGAASTFDTSSNALAELYAMAKGWTPFAIVGRDLDDQRPVDSCLGENATFRGAPVLVATQNGGLAAIALGGDPIHLWLNESDGESWREWVKIVPPPPLAGVALGFAATTGEPGGRVIDVVVMDGNEVFYSSYDRANRRASEWTSLGSPPSDERSGLSIAPDGSGGLFVYTYGRRPPDHAIYVREFDGMAWSDWRSLPALGFSSSAAVLSLAAVSIAREQHLVAATGAGLRYAARNTSGTWSDWHVLKMPTLHDAENLNGIALVSNAHFTLAWLGSTSHGGLWFSGCDQASCVDEASWSTPYVIGATGAVTAAASTPSRIDVSALLMENRPGTPAIPCLGGMWHKRWQAPE
jgi:hypothetical protein